MELSKKEIDRRLIRLRNLEHLYSVARERITLLETENKQLKTRIKELEGKDRDKDKRIEDLSYQFEQIKNEFETHQLCWAHPQRKLRDLAESAEFGKRKQKQILKTYGQFSQLYKNIRKKLGSPFTSYIKNKFQNISLVMTEHHSLDPTALSKIKTSLRKNKEKYFTFLYYPNIPMDNNKAERALRHIVIKRKTSFGSKTQRGAETTSILASVILSLKWNDPQTWFQKYLKLAI